MKLGVVVSTDPWRFFNDIFEEWKKRYHVSVFEYARYKAPFFNERINRYRFQHELQAFLETQDVVFFEWASDLLAAASRLPKTTRIVTRLHRYEMFNWVHQVDWEKVDKVVLVSQAMREKFIARFPSQAEKAVVIHESVDVRKFRPAYEPFRGELGTLCYLGPRKRVYELVLAFAELGSQARDLRLHIGGGGNKHGDYTDALFSLVKKLNLGDRVVFDGDVSQPWTWYPKVDIFVSNSYSEGLQVAPMEAMASGRYTLSHWWDGAEELLPEQQLYLTNRELQEKILAYAGMDESLRRQKQEEMRLLAEEKFDTRLILSRLTALVEEVAQERRVPVTA